jgi:hypothetical protein
MNHKKVLSVLVLFCMLNLSILPVFAFGTNTPGQKNDTSLTVSSIRALNTKQIEVKFNLAMDSSSATNVNFYEIKDKGTKVIALTTEAIKLVDSKTAVITLNKTITDKLTNKSTAKVKIKKGIKSANGTKLSTNVQKDVSVSDSDKPTVINAEAVGEKTIKIIFSEPVYDGTNNSNIDFSSFIVKSDTYSYYILSTKLSGNTITLNLSTNLLNGKVDITVNPSGINTAKLIKDYAGYVLSESNTSFEFQDPSIIRVTVKEATTNSIKLKFSKPIYAKNLVLYHSVKNSKDYMSAPISIKEGTFESEITFTFVNRLPIGEISLYLTNSTTPGEEMTDSSGIKVPNQKVICDIL